ncbi:cytochrome P450 [Xylariaceae sp. FL1651]|nr:cytochrome P450 [Xylariaceae sp. FL1651]
MLLLDYLQIYLNGVLEEKGSSPKTAFLPFVLLLVYLVWTYGSSQSKQPPKIPESIPFLSNTYLFATNHNAFLEKCVSALRNSSIAQFRLGGTRTYVITGTQNIQAIFMSTAEIRDETMMETYSLPKLWAMPQKEVDYFRKDRIGRGKIPLPGSNPISEDQRHWAINHHIYEKFLGSKRHTNLLAEKYYEVFTERLNSYPTDQWSEVFVMGGLMKRDMAESALIALAGPKLLELNPGFFDKFWEFDPLLADLCLGKPRWLNPSPWRIRDSYHDMTRKFIESAWANFDWTGPDKDADWEEQFGARICRELARWLRGSFSIEAQAGFFGALFIGQNSNTVAISAWALMELMRDPELFKAVEEELLTLPLLQSVYVETMRLRMSFSPMREVVAPVRMGGYDLKKGSLIFAPNYVAHYNESAWGVEGHPASEFWGARHVKYVDRKDQHGHHAKGAKFEMASHRNNFFPFGGGPSMCPGRFFAKQEILMTLAILVERFDIEFVGWTHLDGRQSDRAAQNDVSCAGAVAIPPDRDMKVRLRRRL